MNFQNGEAEFWNEKELKWWPVGGPPDLSNPKTECDQVLPKPHATKWFLVLASVLCGPRETVHNMPMRDLVLYVLYTNHACQEEHTYEDGPCLPRRRRRYYEYAHVYICVLLTLLKYTTNASN